MDIDQTKEDVAYFMRRLYDQRLTTTSGGNQTPHLKPSMESKMHLAIYHLRPDVKAIIHAHPVFSTSFCISKKEIKTNLVGETWAVKGVPFKADYRLNGNKRFNRCGC